MQLLSFIIIIHETNIQIYRSLFFCIFYFAVILVLLSITDINIVLINSIPEFVALNFAERNTNTTHRVGGQSRKNTDLAGLFIFRNLPTFKFNKMKVLD